MCYNDMEELEAQRVVTAHAACSIADGCSLCPMYDEARDRAKQQRICSESISARSVREALTVLRGYNGWNSDKK